MANTESNPDYATEPATLSPEAVEMLRILGKNNLREVSDEEWARYSAQRGISDLLCGEYWQWHLPNVEFLMLIHGKERLEATIQHWTSVHDRTADNHVKRHALDQIKLLEDNDEH
jgi:hypothetical protein